MKKVFISAGEVSGDLLGAWYLKKQKGIQCEANGGQFLQQAGATIYQNIDTLGFAGIVEIVKHIPFILKFLNQLTNYIVNSNFDEVVLVDFPGFNLMLAKRLKKKKPGLKITYLSPPQLWVWGAWKIKKIKKFCDEVIVIYPFEVEWYKKRGVRAKWLGYPFYKDLSKYFLLAEKKENKIAILPGSRHSETKTLLPYLVEVTKLLQNKYPSLQFVLPLAPTFKKEDFHYFDGVNIKIVTDEDEKLTELATCCLAISKPGTASLQLALLKVPTVIVYKTSILTFRIAKLLVRVNHMGLANLLLNKETSPELLQQDCTVTKIFKQASRLYEQFLSSHPEYDSKLKDLAQLQHMLNS